MATTGDHLLMVQMAKKIKQDPTEPRVEKSFLSI